VRANWRVIFRFQDGRAADVDLVDYHQKGDSVMLNPPHPGRIVRQECLEALGLSVTEAAKVLGVTRQTLNNLVNEKAAISPEMAIRLEKAFGSTADTWLRMQAAYDLAQARKKADNIHVTRFVPV
jgi:addiction module HigA family antidote